MTALPEIFTLSLLQKQFFPFKPTEIQHHPLHSGQNFQGVSYNKIYGLKNQVNLCLVRQPVYQESKQSPENENV